MREAYANAVSKVDLNEGGAGPSRRLAVAAERDKIVPEKKTGSYPRESGLIELSVQLLADEKLRTFCTSAQQRMRRYRKRRSDVSV